MTFTEKCANFLTHFGSLFSLAVDIEPRRFLMYKVLSYYYTKDIAFFTRKC